MAYKIMWDLIKRAAEDDIATRTFLYNLNFSSDPSFQSAGAMFSMILHNPASEEAHDIVVILSQLLWELSLTLPDTPVNDKLFTQALKWNRGVATFMFEVADFPAYLAELCEDTGAHLCPLLITRKEALRSFSGFNDNELNVLMFDLLRSRPPKHSIASSQKKKAYKRT